MTFIYNLSVNQETAARKGVETGNITIPEGGGGGTTLFISFCLGETEQTPQVLFSKNIRSLHPDKLSVCKFFSLAPNTQHRPSP